MWKPNRIHINTSNEHYYYIKTALQHHRDLNKFVTGRLNRFSDSCVCVSLLHLQGKPIYTGSLNNLKTEYNIFFHILFTVSNILLRNVKFILLKIPEIYPPQKIA